MNGRIPAGSIECSRTPRAPKNEGELFNLRNRAWHDQGVLVVDLTNPPRELSYGDKLAIEALAIRLYGKRKEK